MEKEHEEILQSHTVKLTNNLEPKPLILYLYEKDIIDRRDREEILSKETRYDMSEALLFKLTRKGPEAFPELVKGLEENQPFLACILLEAVKHREILQKHTGKLTDSLKPIPLINYLHEKGIIDDIDRIEIKSKETQCEMSKALLFKLRRKGSEAYRELVKGLEEKQPSLACILLREEKERLENKIAEIERERKQKEKKLNKLIQELQTQLQCTENEKNQLEEKIQELENRTSSRLRRALSHERPPPTKEFTLSYKSDFDNRGVIYYLGFQAGFNQWVNPALVPESGVEVTCSDSSRDAANILEYFDPKRCSDSSWWCVDLGEKYTLRLSHYTLRQTGSDLRSFPKKWELQGRLNVNDKWISLRTHRDVNWKNEPITYVSNRSLPCKTKTWPIDGEVKPFRYFKIGRIEGETYEPTYRLHLAGMELYGVLSIMKQN